MLEGNNHCWAVLCKNRLFHFWRSPFKGHQIPLCKSDGVMSPPPLDEHFPVTCSECGQEYLYKSSEVRRHKITLPQSFTPHPLFRLDKDRRRSRRSVKDVRLIVRGESKENGGFQEKTYATSVSTHGALMILSTMVAEGQKLFLKNPRTENEIEGRVVRFGPPYRGLTQVGVEFVRPAEEFWPSDVVGHIKVEEYARVGTGSQI